MVAARDGARERADVDDLAAASARDHPPRRLAADLKRGGEMRFQDPAPFAGRDIDHRFAELVSGIVDEDVDREAFGVEMLECRADRRFVGDVKCARRHAMARRLEGLGGRSQFALVPAVENERRAGPREASRHCEPKTVRGAGDERRLARQIEEFGDVHFSLRDAERSKAAD